MRRSCGGGRVGRLGAAIDEAQGAADITKRYEVLAQAEKELLDYYLITPLDVPQPQVEIEVDLEKAEAYGVKPGDVRRAASTLLSGLTAGTHTVSIWALSTNGLTIGQAIMQAAVESVRAWSRAMAVRQARHA